MSVREKEKWRSTKLIVPDVLDDIDFFFDDIDPINRSIRSRCTLLGIFHRQGYSSIFYFLYNLLYVFMYNKRTGKRVSKKRN